FDEMQDWNQLVDVLRRASSQHSSEFVPATQLLKEFESQPGFHLALLKIALSLQISEIPVRLIAVLFFKNGIERHWRTHGPSPITNEEKIKIREIICECFNEPVQQIALQFAVVTSKIGRYDYPKLWPDIMPYMVREIQQQLPNSDVIKDNTILLTFRLFMKELSTKRLPNDKKIFLQVCQQLFASIFKLWGELTLQVASDLQNHEQNTQKITFDMHKLINVLKSFRCISPALQNESRIQFLVALLSSLRQFLQFSQKCCSLELFQKLLILHSKIILDMLESNQRDIEQLFSETLAISRQCIFEHAKNGDLFQERFVVNCMNQVKCMASDNETACKILPIADVEEIMRCLVFHFLPLTSGDLERWEEDVEDFCSEEIGETWKYNLRPSAEVLFLTFLHSNPEQLVPMIISALNSVNEKIKTADKSSSDVGVLMENDAVLSAVGLAANELFDCLNFESWFMEHLLPYDFNLYGNLITSKIHRRVLWLIDQWMGVKPPVEIRTTLYDFIIGSLSPGFNMAVRLTAASALRQVLDDFEFELDSFVAYQDRCTDGLYRLLQDCEAGDTRMRVLHVLSFVIERLGPQVVTCIQQLADILPSIWLTSESHNMLRCAVVSTLVNLVMGLRGDSPNLHPFLIPVIHACTDVSSPAHIYLLIDGLELWVAVLRNAVAMTPELLHLFNNLFALLIRLSSESLKDCFHLVECYAILGRLEFIKSEQCFQFANSLLSIISDVNDKCLLVVCKLVSTIIGADAIEASEVFTAYIKDNLQRFLSESFNGVLSTARMLLIARLALRHPVAFWQHLNNYTGEQFNQAASYLFNMFSTWIDSVAEITHRKEIALAVLTLLDNFNEIEAVRSSIPHIICITVHVLHDVCDEDHVDSVVILDSDDVADADWSDNHVKRESLLKRSDPVHVISLPHFARSKLEIVANFLGGPAALDELLRENVDQQILTELRELISFS
uniref:Importin N-terminal domain-containing protein n=1 Tax=Ciona savignyi TaxID=51511 RepID=H2YLD0_CIOSA